MTRVQCVDCEHLSLMADLDGHTMATCLAFCEKVDDPGKDITCSGFRKHVRAKEVGE